ncbi:hypothetical protein VTJ49DRAFT_6424 [Mycothermus thermophilus]|uniref:Zn(2)-C6 fungal-type domain-containing protein n=1 Tax=Humicola insolens TaxID=85995 RepID=A0ABR3VJA2_HUMIN
MAASAAEAATETSSSVVTGGKRKSRSEGEGSDRAGSEHASSPAPSSWRSSAKPQVRHRASIACASCRERRIRCVVPEGETECSQCRRTGSTCIIKDDDERRRWVAPISKAYMSSLSNRIALLEEMLRERGVVPPPAVHPPKTRHEAQLARQREEQLRAAQASNNTSTTTANSGTSSEPRTNSEPKLPPPTQQPAQPPTPPGSSDEDIPMPSPSLPEPLVPTNTASFNRLIDPLLLQDSSEPKPKPPTTTTTRHLLSTRGTFLPSPSTPNHTRYFGPTANSHVHANANANPAASSLLSALVDEPHERAAAQQHRASLVIATLPAATHDYLLRCFWERYNAWQPVVDEAGFTAGRRGSPRLLYSPFLHLAMLAVGYRFAEWEREDVKRLVLGGEGGRRESTLHREARGLVEGEVERPGGVASVQGLLLMAELEFGVGRDGSGWMFSGMANRLAFDIGLHVQPGAEVSELERQTRRQAMSACVMFDRRWALFLGRPTSIKMQDIRVDVVPRISPMDAGMSPPAAYRAIHRQMFELLELAGRVADFQNTISGGAHVFPSKAAEDRAYLHFVGLERLFHNWYRRLNETDLAWRPVNIKNAHAGFFLLHLQFHACMILLHRPWAKYGPLLSLDGAAAGRYPSPESPTTEDGTATGFPSWMASLQHHDNRASMSRSMCTQHAIRIARIFWHHRQRFDARRVPLAATQHAGTAALALMAALAHKSAELDHQSNLRYLQVLSAAIYDMSHLYQPAARMYQLLKTMLVEIRSDMVRSGGFDVSSFLGRYPSTSTMMFGGAGSSSSSTSTAGGSLWANGLAEDDRAAKRRRLSSVTSLDFASTYTTSPSLLRSTSVQAPCLSPPTSVTSAKSLDSANAFTLGSTTAPLQAPEPTTATVATSTNFDMDFFPTSFMDFLGPDPGGADGITAPASTTATAAVPTTLPFPGAHDWATGHDTSPAMLIPTVSGDLACLSSSSFGIGSASASSSVAKPTSADNAASLAPESSGLGDNNNNNEDDDTSADKTIEDWLAEPSTKPPPANNTSGTTADVAVATTSTAKPTATTQQQKDKQKEQQRTASLSHATADGTPICRDPYVLSLQTELGIGFGLGPDEAPATGAPLSPTATASTAGGSVPVPVVPDVGGVGVGEMNLVDVNVDMGMDLHVPGLDGLEGIEGLDAMEWFHADADADADGAETHHNRAHEQQQKENNSTMTAAAAAAASTAADTTPANNGSSAGDRTGTSSTTNPAPPPPPASSVVPVAPVTLDELVQSVEEAVGSARARARARAAAAAAAAGASSSAGASSAKATGPGVGGGSANSKDQVESSSAAAGGCGREEAVVVVAVSPGMTGKTKELDFLAL